MQSAVPVSMKTVVSMKTFSSWTIPNVKDSYDDDCFLTADDKGHKSIWNPFYNSSSVKWNKLEIPSWMAPKVCKQDDLEFSPMPGIFTPLPPLLPGSWLPITYTTKITGGGLIKSLSCPQTPAEPSGRIASNGHPTYCLGVMAQTSLQPLLRSVLQQKSSHGFAQVVRQRDSRMRTRTSVYISLHLF